MRAAFYTTSIALSALVLTGTVAAVEPSVNTHVHRNPRADLRMSNAKRLASGRPLRRPRQLRAAQILGNSEPSANVAPVANDPAETCFNGFIQVTNAIDIPQGYLATPLDASGVFNTLVTSANDPDVLTVCLHVSEPDSGLQYILDTGSLGNSTLPYLGAIVGDGFSPNLGQNNEYAYIGLTARSGPQSTPIADPDSTGNSHDEAKGTKQAYESNVWSSRGPLANQQLGLQWFDTASQNAAFEFGQLDDGEIIAASSVLGLQQSGLSVTPINLHFIFDA